MGKKVGILTTNFFSPDGTRMIYGGAERYGLELTRLLLELEYEVSWWQIGSGWKKEILPGVVINTIPETRSELMTFPNFNQHFMSKLWMWIMPYILLPSWHIPRCWKRAYPFPMVCSGIIPDLTINCLLKLNGRNGSAGFT
ncbi:hypothetical protein [Biomaibacter acetigenes]|uniref:hypothetical protein n=1 Tax=Biomaibacter acetigenes TaxID=2316383 RepID=UPI001FE7F431|nr:hypothetical protein [Biomaibacter acetigenes]